MKLCDKCGTKNLNSAVECESCKQLIEVAEPAQKSQIEADAEFQKKVLSTLDDMKYSLSKIAAQQDKEKPVSIAKIPMSISDMAIFILKSTIASLPTVAIIFLISIAAGFAIQG